jgi:acylphosphatase
VQGVFFRDSVRRAALAAGVSGWAKNRADGSVEVVLEGEADAVERLETVVRDGPGHARVERLEVSEETPEGISGFQVH